ncbi:MAG: 30S ribosomal protein S3 [Candidatus Omnitrophica bacterium]|nr:30S ribosomal protein S3 [Candidatus Omnitrophota bacterium]
MGQKVHPISFRLGVIRNWNSRWYSTKEEFADNIIQDRKIRELIGKELTMAHVSRVEIERASNRVRVMIFSGRPGMVIGRKGAQIELIKEKVQSIVGDQAKLFIDIKEVSNPILDAQIVADSIAYQLVKRIAFRRAMKKTIQAHKDAGGKGIKVRCSGRLGGAEIARAEGYKWGKVPLQTIRADIDYGFSEARTTYGAIGVKVWINRGEKFGIERMEEEKEENKKKAERRPRREERKE